MATLNELVKAYLRTNNIQFVAGDYSTEEPDGQSEVISYWNATKLGTQPTQAQLDAMDGVIANHDLVVYSASARYAKETGGITISGVPISTDRDSQGMIDGAFASAKDDNTFTTRWKSATGQFVALDNATILAVGRAVRTHVNNCFGKEADLSAQINSGAITTQSQIDSAYASLQTAF